jgi:hypothetical protein
VIALFGANEITVTDDGMLKTMESGKANFWFPVDSLIFRNTENSEVIVFNENSEGEVTQMYRGGLPIMAFEKVPIISSQKLHYTLFGLAGGAFLLTFIYWPLAYGVRRKYRPTMTANNPISYFKKVTAWLNMLIMLGFFIWVAVLLSGDGGGIIFGLPAGLKVALVLPFISIFLTFGMCYHTYQIWHRNESGIWSRSWYTFLTVFSVTLLWQLYYWNLLGFQY